MADEEVVSTEQPTLEPPPATEVPTEPAVPATKQKSPLSFLDDRVAARRAELEAGHVDIFPKTETPPPAEVPPVEPPPAEPPPSEVAAPAQPASAPAAPAQAAPPVTPTPAKEPKEDWDWREYRRLKRLEKQIKAMGLDLDGAPRQPAATQPAAPPPAAAPVTTPPTADDDPFGVNKALQSVEAVQQRQVALEAQQQAIQRQAILDRQVQDFEREHADYRPALDFLVKSRQAEYRMSGIGDVEGARLLADTRWHPAIEKAQDILSEREQRYVSEEEAAREIAIELKVSAEANDIIDGTLRQNKAVPAVVYDLAKQRGYQPSALMPPLAPSPSAVPPNGTQPAAPTPSPVAEKVRQQAKANAAAKSISNVSSATSNPGAMPTPIKTLSDLAAFKQRDPVAYKQWVNQMEQTDPRWWHRLQAG